MATQRLKLRRGLKENLPTSGMLQGEPLVTLDRGTLHVATADSTYIPVVPALDDLASAAAVNNDADFLLIHDASEASGQKEKKITVSAFKSALNIPEGTEDEKVAVVQGGSSGYLFGTDGTDGVLRVSTGLSVTKDNGNGFITLDVAVVDGGSF